MSAIIVLCFLIALVLLWTVLRVAIFFSVRFGSATIPPDVFIFTIWLHRIFLCVIAAGVAFVAIPGAMFAVGMAQAFGGSSAPYVFIQLILLAIGLYALSALVLNIPGFPLSWHLKAFYPVQFLLLPSLLALAQPTVFLALTAIFAAYFGLWFWNLRDRQNC